MLDHEQQHGKWALAFLAALLTAVSALSVWAIIHFDLGALAH